MDHLLLNTDILFSELLKDIDTIYGRDTGYIFKKNRQMVLCIFHVISCPQDMIEGFMWTLLTASNEAVFWQRHDWIWVDSLSLPEKPA